MKIYKACVDYNHNFASCCVDDEACKRLIPEAKNLESWEMSLWFDGTSRKNGWWPRIMEVCEEGDEPVKPVVGDYTAPLGTGDMILRNECIEKLKDVLENVEILPVYCDFGEYSAVNPMTVLEDCIDLEKSVYSTLPTARPILFFDKFVFKKDIVKGHTLFKVMGEERSHPFVNEEFVEAVKKHGITGFDFRLAWEG